MSANEQGQVKIGPEFFEKVKKDYADWRWAIVREFLQNCIDAPGCSEVSVSVALADGATVLMVANDGEPMSRETLLGKLLTLGGSGKNFDGENTGGFGVAKSLLYYTHRSYTIHTGTLHVAGSGAQWEVSEVEAFAGTRSIVVMEGDHVAALIDMLERFAAMCQWRGTLTVNGKVLETNLRKGARRRDLGWAVVYTNNSAANLCIVRLNGQPMFTRWTRFKGCVLLELTGKADQTLTSNRDALSQKHDGELSDLLTALAVDKRSALREQRAEYKRWHGEKLRNEAKQPKAMDGEGGVAALLGAGSLERIGRLLNGGGKKNVAEPIPQTVEGGGIKLVVVSKEDEADRTISVGPQFILKNTTGMKTPVHYTPGEKFSQYSRELVRSWTALLLKLHQLSDVGGEFSVGFVLDDENEAEHETGVWGRVYYVNPTKVAESEGGRRSISPRFSSAWQGRHELISLAAHEFVHGAWDLKEHDEDYAGKLTDVMALVLRHHDELTALCKPVADERGAAERQKTELFGASVCAVLRWMGLRGWEFRRARAVLDALDCRHVADGTVRSALRSGRIGAGRPAQLTAEQESGLNGVDW